MNVPVPKEPVKTVLIGTGNRSRKIYKPLFKSLKPWIEITAVCDPVREHCDAMADALNTKAYYDIFEMVNDKVAEAAIVVTPIESHHSISVFLSSNGIHNLVETTWCSTLIQARHMISEAEKNNVIIRVAENFFRFPIDRFAQTVKAKKYLGEIYRVFSYNDHTGYHSNSRWIAFAQKHPLWIQSLEHSMPVIEFYETPQRFHKQENFRSRFIMFPDNLLVVDQAANIKGLLGRHVRPGYTEWQGEKGALVQEGYPSTNATYSYYPGDGTVEQIQGVHSDWNAELRLCSKSREECMVPTCLGGQADCISKVIREYDDKGRWTRIYAQTPEGLIEYVNPYRPEELSDNYYPEYGSCVMDHIVDFALAIRGIKESEFDEKDALMSLMMEIAAKESALHGGKRIELPLADEELEAEKIILDNIKKQLGVDPFDIEAMLRISYKKP